MIFAGGRGNKADVLLGFDVISLFYLLLRQGLTTHPGLTGAHYVDQAGFELTESHLQLAPRG